MEGIFINPLMLLWANVHGSFKFGLAAIAFEPCLDPTNWSFDYRASMFFGRSVLAASPRPAINRTSTPASKTLFQLLGAFKEFERAFILA